MGPYSDTVLVTSFSPGSSTCASRVRSLNSDLPNNTEYQDDTKTDDFQIKSSTLTLTVGATHTKISIHVVSWSKKNNMYAQGSVDQHLGFLVRLECWAKL
ncbi:hypothetical protein TNCV_3980351 [Trichonephila clavipes]|nr:hypothetical protein TNCV_3980351 [Trichonephila clavipes]